MNYRIATILIVVVLVGGVVYYRENLIGYFDRPEKSAAITRELKEAVTYSVPDGQDTVTFSVFVDQNGVIADARALDQEDPTNPHLLKFAQGLRTVIVGKKLSELGPVDKIGTASLTTAAFNSALANLKVQL